MPEIYTPQEDQQAMANKRFPVTGLKKKNPILDRSSAKVFKANVGDVHVAVVPLYGTLHIMKGLVWIILILGFTYDVLFLYTGEAFRGLLHTRNKIRTKKVPSNNSTAQSKVNQNRHGQPGILRGTPAHDSRPCLSRHDCDLEEPGLLSGGKTRTISPICIIPWSMVAILSGLVLILARSLRLSVCVANSICDSNQLLYSMSFLELSCQFSFRRAKYHWQADQTLQALRNTS